MPKSDDSSQEYSDFDGEGSDIEMSEGEDGMPSGSNSEDYEMDVDDSYDEDGDSGSEDEPQASSSNDYTLSKADRRALATGKLESSERSKRKQKYDENSDSEGSEPLSDTEYAYSRPNLSHIRSKERNTYPSCP